MASKLSSADFEFRRELGEGSYSRVVEAIRLSTGEEFAVKIMDKRHIVKEGKAENVKRERNVLSMLAGHPNIIELKCTFQDSASLYVITELAPGGDLQKLIKKNGPLSVDAARFYAAEVVNALEFMHRKGVIHRDLKPENMLLTASGHIKIVDFGSAKVLGQLDESEPPKKNTFCGTAEYVSPEVLLDRPVTKSADLWALGCFIYQLLIGRPPFRGRSEYLTFQKILSLDYSLPKDLPDDCKDIIQRLLVIDSQERLGAGPNDYDSLKSHPFFTGIDFLTLPSQTPPLLFSGRSSEPASNGTPNKNPPYLVGWSSSESDETNICSEVKALDIPRQPEPWETLVGRPVKHSGPVLVRSLLPSATSTSEPSPSSPTATPDPPSSTQSQGQSQSQSLGSAPETIATPAANANAPPADSKRESPCRQLVLTEDRHLLIINPSSNMIELDELLSPSHHAKLTDGRRYTLSLASGHKLLLEDPTSRASLWCDRITFLAMPSSDS